MSSANEQTNTDNCYGLSYKQFVEKNILHLDMLWTEHELNNFPQSKGKKKCFMDKTKTAPLNSPTQDASLGTGGVPVYIFYLFVYKFIESGALVSQEYN